MPRNRVNDGKCMGEHGAAPPHRIGGPMQVWQANDTFIGFDSWGLPLATIEMLQVDRRRLKGKSIKDHR